MTVHCPARRVCPGMPLGPQPYSKLSLPEVSVVWVVAADPDTGRAESPIHSSSSEVGPRVASYPFSCGRGPNSRGDSSD